MGHHGLRYVDIARETISSFGLESLNEFLETIKPNQGRAFVSYIRVNGFRRGSDPEYQRQRAILARRISGDGADQPAGDKDWDALAKFWATWAGVEFSDRELLELTRSYMLNVGDVDATIDGIIKRLAYLSKEQIASREQLQLYISYAPFQTPADAAANIVDHAVDSEAIAKAEIVRRLPQTIEALEAQIESFGQHANVEFAQMNGLIKQQAEQILKVAADITREAERFNGFEANLEQANSKISLLLESTKSAANHDEESQRQLSSLSGSLLDANERIAALTRRIEDLSAKLESVDRHLAPNTEAVSEKASVERAGELPALLYRRPCSQFAIETITSSGELASSFDALRASLSAMGLTPDSADQTAAEVLAGVASGQLVTFSGSMSLLVAQVCAVSIVGPGVSVVDIPLGHSDVRSFDAVTSELDVILNNANAGSFEIYASSLCAHVADAQLRSKAPGRLRFAALMPPPIGLPQEIFSQLGPVVDTETLSWGDSLFRKPIQTAGAALQYKAAGDGEAREFWLDLNECLEKAGRPRTELWRRVIINAYSVIQNLPPASSGSDTRDVSILASWIIPYLRARGMSGKAVAETLALVPALAAVTGNARISAMLR